MFIPTAIDARSARHYTNLYIDEISGRIARYTATLYVF
jgi:hypothetical protein